ncbi:MAG: c-type cytochrome [Planctomycetaceae bacterium]
MLPAKTRDGQPTPDFEPVVGLGQLALRHACHAALSTFFVVVAGSVLPAADPAIPGNHPLTQAQAGELIIAELRCAACHKSDQPDSHFIKAAPDLSEAGSRISPEYLRKYLAAPSAVHPDTSMPDVLASRPEAERDQIADALTHFLVAQSKKTFQPEAPEESDSKRGRELFHSIGCVACHGPQEEIAKSPAPQNLDDAFDDDELLLPKKKEFQPIAVSLQHVGAKYSVTSLSNFLFQPLLVRHSGRMPDLKLTRNEAASIASYLLRAPAGSHQALEPQESLVTKGQQYFRELNCAACHTLPGTAPAPLIGSLRTADFSKGCLSATSLRSPKYNLAEAKRGAIVAALQEKPSPDSDEVVAAKTMTAFRCIACHERNDFGGVPQAYDAYFAGSEVKMGDDGRIPPPLTLVGAKLRPAWLKKVLFDGESVRPYMFTRMPQYGTANLQHLPDVVARLDVLEGREMQVVSSERRTPEEREREKVLRAAGRELLGDKGVNCIACHRFNGKDAPVNQGIDLLTTYQRLQPAWFDQYVRNPMAFRPRTVMPSAWSGGVASHKTILDGNADQQIEAVWYYLSLGTSAADPSGIRGVSTNLIVNDVPRLHRGRSQVAGYRGIAVGFPEKLNYAFNAETGTLSAVWKGDFINVNWSGQGSGNFNPSVRPIELAQDVSFVQLKSESDSWPLMPVMTKEEPVNPDPLYPKNVGYQFGGYALDEKSIPTFMYRSGTIEIEDRTAPGGSPEHSGLTRVLQFKSPESQTVWFRALTGQVSSESPQVYRSGQMQLTVPECETVVRAFGEEGRQSELLLRLELPQGESRLELLYEPIDK